MHKIISVKHCRSISCLHGSNRYRQVVLIACQRLASSISKSTTCLGSGVSVPITATLELVQHRTRPIIVLYVPVARLADVAKARSQSLVVPRDADHGAIYRCFQYKELLDASGKLVSTTQHNCFPYDARCTRSSPLATGKYALRRQTGKTQPTIVTSCRETVLHDLCGTVRSIYCNISPRDRSVSPVVGMCRLAEHRSYIGFTNQALHE